VSNEFAARLGWVEMLDKTEAKVLSAALNAVLEIPGEEIESLNEGENELLDVLTEAIAVPEESSAIWVRQIGDADREAVSDCLLWLTYPEREMTPAQWQRLEEVAAAVWARAASLGAHEMEMA
jgi:hypothetical protein